MRALLVVVMAWFGCWTGSTVEPAEPVAVASSAPQPPREPRRPAPTAGPRCEISADAPVRATSLGGIRVEVPDGRRLVKLNLASAGPTGSSMQFHVGTSLATTIAVAPGSYVLELELDDGTHVRCDDVGVAAGGVTIVAIAS